MSWLIIVALVIRFQQFVHLRKWQIVCIELLLMAVFVGLNWWRRKDFFLSFSVGDVWAGLSWGITIVGLEMFYDQYFEPGLTIHWQSLYLIPAAILIVGWASAFYEELLFRALVFANLRTVLGRPWLAIVLQGLLFGLAHWNRYFLSGHWHHALSTTLLGIVLGVLTWQRKSIVPAWIVHTLVNSYGVIYLVPDSVVSRAVESWMR